MPALRFNHLELTLPKGSLSEGGVREEIKQFYGEVFGFEALDVHIVNQNALLLRSDAETSQFILLTEMAEPIHSPSYDHLGFLYETRAEVDELLEKCEKWMARDDRVKIKRYEDLDTGGSVVHAFYVKYLLPLYFDVQCMEYKSAADRPAKRWRYVGA